jgi:hypothetical protein
MDTRGRARFTLKLTVNFKDCFPFSNLKNFKDNLQIRGGRLCPQLNTKHPKMNSTENGLLRREERV